MSNHLAVATTTAALRLLAGRAARVVPGAQVSTMRPSELASQDLARGLNIFLYMVTPNPVLSNEDLPARRADGSLLQKPQAALDLHYVVSFFGDEIRLEPQILLGSLVAQIRQQPFLTPSLIREAMEVTSGAPLAGSGLDAQPARVTVMMELLDTNTLTRLWSMFLQTPYYLSLTLRCSTVLIESDVTPVPRPPARTVDIGAKPEVP